MGGTPQGGGEGIVLISRDLEGNTLRVLPSPSAFEGLQRVRSGRRQFCGVPEMSKSEWPETTMGIHPPGRRIPTVF